MGKKPSRAPRRGAVNLESKGINGRLTGFLVCLAGLVLAIPASASVSGVLYRVVGSGPGARVEPVSRAVVRLRNLDTGVLVDRLDLGPAQQGQITTGQGFYRFDVGLGALPGRFVIEVEPGSADLLFPSQSIAPAGAGPDNPLGVAAVAGADGRVVADSVPAVGETADRTYFLRFFLDSDPSRPAFSNNHIPVDNLTQRVRLELTPDRVRVVQGEPILFTATISAPPQTAALEGVRLLLRTPPGLRIIGKRARLIGSGGERLVELQRSGAGQTTVAPIILEESVRIRFRAAVIAGALGELRSVARLFAPGNTRVSNEAVAVVQAARDPIFDESVVLGRVFCDADGDGGFGPGDHGLPGARIFTDEGVVVSTDSAGRYHLPRMLPGRHLLKLDARSLAPGSSPTSALGWQRAVALTPGLLGKVDFGVLCASEEVRAKEVFMPVRPPPPEHPRLHLVLDPEVEEAPISVDGTAVDLPWVDGVLTRANEFPDYRSGRGRTLGAPGDLMWNIETKAQVVAWQISVFDASAKEVYRLAGEGPPPPRNLWPQPDWLFDRAGLYRYRVVVKNSLGDIGEGRWRIFEVPAAASLWQQAGQVEGDLFTVSVQAANPMRPVLREFLDALAGRLREASVDRIRVEVGVASSAQRRSERVLRSQRYAGIVRDGLVERDIAADLVEALGTGDSTSGKVTVTVSHRLLPAEDEPRAALSYPALIGLNGETLTEELLLQGRSLVRQVESGLTEAGEPDAMITWRRENGQRVQVRRRQGQAELPMQARGERQSRIEVDATARTVRLSGSTIAQPSILLGVQCEASFNLSSRQLEVKVTATPTIVSWQVKSYSRVDRVLQTLSFTEAGEHQMSITTAAVPAYVRCLGRDAQGGWALSPKIRVHLPAPPGQGPATEETVFYVAEDYPRRVGRAVFFSERLRLAVIGAVRRLSLDAEARLVVGVHSGRARGRSRARLDTARTVRAIESKLRALGASASQIEVRAFGAERPAVQGRAHRRIEWLMVPGAAPAASETDAAGADAHVSVAGREVEFDAHGRASATIGVPASGALPVMVLLPSGERISQVLLLAGQQSGTAMRPPNLHDAPWGSGPGSLAIDFAAAWQAPTPRPAQAVVRETGPVTLPLIEAEAHAAVSQLLVRLPKAESVLSSRTLTVYGSAARGTKLRINGKPVPVGAAGDFHSVVALKPAPTEGHASAAVAALLVEAEDASGNTATIERQFAVPHSEWFALGLANMGVGFGAQSPLTLGEGRIELSSRTRLLGRLAAVIQGTMYKPGAGGNRQSIFGIEELRLTAFLDTGRPFAPNLAADFGRPETLYPVYGDGSRPEALTPRMSGDFSAGAAALGKFYLRLEADDSTLTIGHHTAGLVADREDDEQVAEESGRLLRYSRPQLGAQLKLNVRPAAGHQTLVAAFVGATSRGLAQRSLVFQATGGVLYQLPDRAVVLGSEEVSVVVRDAVSGSILRRQSLRLGVDYDLDPLSGRLILSRPISMALTGDQTLNPNLFGLLRGQPKFVEVRYSYSADAAQMATLADDLNRPALGFSAEHRLTFGSDYDLRLGAALVDENRNVDVGEHYRLFGLSAGLSLGPLLRVRVEVARSNSRDSDAFVSLDGGQGFSSLGIPQRSAPGQRGDLLDSEVSGWAARLNIDGDIRRMTTAGAARGMPFSLDFAHQDPNFFAGLNRFAQGQTSGGGQLRWLLDDKGDRQLHLRSHWSASWLYLSNEDRRVSSGLSEVGYSHRLGDWRLGGAVRHGMVHDAERPFHHVALGVSAEWRVAPRWRVFFAQEVLPLLQLRQAPRDANGASSRQATQPGDHAESSVGVRFNLTDRTWLSLQESVRWSGSNRTELSLRQEIDETLEIYAAERLFAVGRRWSAVSVVGAESRDAVGSRSYAEVHRQHNGGAGRAVFGTNNRWAIAPRTWLSLAYERAQRVGGALTPAPGDGALSQANLGSVVATPGQRGFGSGVLAVDRAFAAGGFANAGIFPGAGGSRDVFSVGLEARPRAWLATDARLELRYDRATAEQGGDRLTFFGQGGAQMSWADDLQLFVRARGASVSTVETSFNEAQFLDLSLGAALRPAASEVFGGLFKWTRRYQRSAVDSSAERFSISRTDVVSGEPYVEVGGGIQLLAKLAVKVSRAEDPDLRPIDNIVWLAVARVNVHLTGAIDAALEYRWLAQSLARRADRGALAEVAWLIGEHMSLGVGYNFSGFSDDLLAGDAAADAGHGFFVRATGRY